MLVPFLLLFLAAFVIGGVLIAIDEPLWAMVAFVGLILVAVVDMVAITFRIGRGDRRLARRTDTRRGRATILEAQEIPLTLHLGGSTYQPRTFRLRLRVELPDAEPYEVVHHVGARPWDVDHIRPGNVIECRVHPRRRKRLVLVFPEGTTEFGVTDPGAVRSIDPNVGGPGGALGAESITQLMGDPQVARLVRESSGLDIEEIVRRALAGEEIPGVMVHHGVGSDTPSPVVPTPPSHEPPMSGPADGLPATAVVQGLVDQGATTGGHRRVELDLLVQPTGDVPYRVALEAELAPEAIPRLGSTVPVEVDPRRPARVRLTGR